MCSNKLNYVYLRQYVSVEKLTLQDGWTVDVRRRMKGKGQGGLYMVYITPQGRQRLTLSLGLYTNLGGIWRYSLCITMVMVLLSKKGACFKLHAVIRSRQVKESSNGRRLFRSQRSCQNCTREVAWLCFDFEPLPLSKIWFHALNWLNIPACNICCDGGLGIRRRMVMMLNHRANPNDRQRPSQPNL